MSKEFWGANCSTFFFLPFLIAENTSFRSHWPTLKTSFRYQFERESQKNETNREISSWLSLMCASFLFSIFCIHLESVKDSDFSHFPYILYKNLNTKTFISSHICKREKNKFTTHINARINSTHVFPARIRNTHRRHQRREWERSASYPSVAGEEIKNIARYLT